MRQLYILYSVSISEKMYFIGPLDVLVFPKRINLFQALYTYIPCLHIRVHGMFSKRVPGHISKYLFNLSFSVRLGP